ncbi:MAG: hypothetical protein GY855_11165, partial [candidate division Zixibacteria bacterium]|nr:hypothetical protein [candidate division Zixibacteria bacterium]
MLFNYSSIQTETDRDEQYRIKSIQAGTIVERDYTHDFNGNITSMTDNATTQPPISMPPDNDTYTYISDTNKIDTIDTLFYTYDDNGHIIYDGVRDFIYNESNRL